MLENVWIDCPYCGEPFETSVDCSAGGQQYVEDCPVCCQPIDMESRIDLDGKLQNVDARRCDE